MKNSFMLSILVTLTLLLTAISCGLDDHDDHEEEVPVGFQLLLNGDLLVTQEDGTVTYSTGDAIEIPQGEVTGPVDVQFIADDGDVYTPDQTENSLDLTLSGETVITIDHPVGGSEWRFNVTGENPGNVTVTFNLIHAGHSDFESQPINFNVAEGGSVE